MPNTRRIASALTLLAALIAAAPGGEARAQAFPDKPVRLVTAAAGAAGDFVSRMIAPGLTERWGQSVLVDNRGGSAVIPIEAVAKASPDGYTLLVFGSALWHLPFLQSVSYSPSGDFAAVTLAATTPLVLVVHPSLPVRSVPELVALAKRRPGQLNYSSGIAGSATHLPAELFKSMAGVDIVRVAYKGGAPALNALLGGETHLMFATASAGMPQVKAGKLRALAVTSAQRSALVPELPTVAETALPGYEAASTMCVFAPAATPPALVQRIAQDIVQVLTRVETKERFLKAGFEVIATTPQDLAQAMKADMATVGKLIREAGIRAN